MHNTFGTSFSITSFGESHGILIGIIVDGCPSGLHVNIEKIQKELNKRRPGQSNMSTNRNEEDKIKILSGVLNGRSTGAPICMIIENKDTDSSKYEKFRKTPRPSHVDYPAIMRYGKFVDLRGSGRFSGRITAGFVMAGAIAKQLLNVVGIKIAAYTRSVNNIVDNTDYSIYQITESVEQNLVRSVDLELSKKMEEIIQKTKEKNDSVGGIITCIIENFPSGLGNPLFNSIESKISAGIFSIPAVRGIEFGLGFQATKITGSQHNDPFYIKNRKIVTKSNNAGGIVGGISIGVPIKFNVAIKPTASIGIKQDTINLSKMENTKILIEGRHDPCIVPRAVPVVEAITAVVLVDFLIENGNIPKILEGIEKI